MAIELQIYDTFGNRGGTIGGIRISGPLKGYSGLSYTPRGACINKPGSCAFALPMTIRNNYPLDVGAMVFVKDSRWGDQGLFIVGEKSETVAENGHTASFVCTDLVEELRWTDIPGFSSVPAEALSSIYQRLLNIQDETQWAIAMQAGTDVILYDNKYETPGGTVQQAIGQLSAEWFLKWRRGDGRVIEVGTFGRDTGIRLVKPSMRPSGMNRATIRPITPNGINPVKDAAGIVNCLIGLGAGDGWAQVSLRDLYNLVGEVAIPGTTWFRSGPPVAPWVGYDPTYPIYKRYRGDGANDGFQYFLTDADSIARYRKRFNRLHTDIGTVSGNPLDLTAAAAAVYQLTANRLRLFSPKHQSMTITTTGKGSNVGIGGDLVSVEYLEVTRGVTTMDIKGKYTVTDCVRTVDDATGAYSDHFEVSNLGRAAETDAGIQTGMLQELQSLRNAATVYPSGFPIWIDAPITPQSPIQVPWDEDRGRLATVEAIFTVTCHPVYSTVTGGQVAAHHHTATLPGRSQDASVPYKWEQSYNPPSQANYGHAAPGSQANYTHAAPGSQANYGHYADDGSQAWHNQGVANTDTAHGHGSNFSASKSGRVDNGDLGVSGGGSVNKGTADDVTSAIRGHNHTILVNGGGTPSSLGDGVVYVRSNPYHFQASNNQQGQISTDYPGAWSPDPNGHGHGSNFSASKSGRVDNGDLGVSGGGSVGDKGNFPGYGNSYGGFRPSMNQHGGFTPSVDRHDGFTPSVDQHDGFTPDSRFPGHANDLSYKQTIQTSDDVAPGFVPVYGKFVDPAGAARNITVWIDGAQVKPADNPSGVYATSFTINLTPYLQGQQARTIEFRSETLGRLLIRGRIRTRVSIYHIGG